MATIIKRSWRQKTPLGTIKRTSYGYSLQVNGKQERKLSAEWSMADAQEALALRLKQVEAGKIRPATVTLGALAEQYLDYKGRQAKRSLREDVRIVNRQLLPAFGNLPLRRLSEAVIANYEKTRAGEVSAFTVSNELSVLRHMLNLGKRWGYISEVPEIEMPKKPEGRLRFLSAEEIVRLITACQASRNPYLGTIVTVALNTGLRKEELLGLEWERVNLSTAMLTVYKTKSGKPRSVPINSDLEAALRTLEPDPVRRVGYLFKKGSTDARWGQIRTGFTTALDRAGIKGFRFHDLRHTFASHFVMRGGSLHDLKEILGHADFKMTLRYAHLSPQHLRGSMERMEGLTSQGTTSSAHGSALGGKITPECSVSPLAPVAQVDRAAVS